MVGKDDCFGLGSRISPLPGERLISAPPLQGSMARDEGNRERMLDALDCYISLRSQRPRGDYSQAINALHEMDKEESGGKRDIVSEILNAKPVEKRREQSKPIPKAKPAGARTPEVPKVQGDPKVQESPKTRVHQNVEVKARPGSPAKSSQPAQKSKQSLPVQPNPVQSPPKKRGSAGISCRSCGLPLRKGAIDTCTSCGVDVCPSCGEYQRLHKQSQVFFNYKFDYPLCKDCYLNSFKTQEEIGRASTYYGIGSLTYAGRHVAKAIELASSWPGGEMYLAKAKSLQESIEKARGGMLGHSKRISKKGPQRRSESRVSSDVEGDKWAKKFVERALSRKVG